MPVSPSEPAVPSFMALSDRPWIEPLIGMSGQGKQARFFNAIRPERKFKLSADAGRVDSD